MPSHPALLMWASRDTTGTRDTLYCCQAPFDEPHRSLCVVDGQIDAIAWTTSGRGLVTVSPKDPPMRQLVVIDDTPHGPTVARALDVHDSDAFVTLEPQQQGTVQEHDDAIFVTVDVRSTTTVVSRLDALNLRTGVRTPRLSPEPTVYTRCVGVFATQPLSVLTRQESGVQAPRYELVALDGLRRVATGSALPRLRSTPHCRQVLQFTRADGVELTGVLHLPLVPAGADRLSPVVVCPHPTFTTPARPTNLRRIGLNQYPLVLGNSPLGLVAAGYAVLHDCSFPLVQRDGSPMESYADQMRMNAAACVDALASTGVVDASRIAVYGHSLGGFLVVTLAARPSPFKVVIARSGAYNRPMTPFGFVFEQRRYWEAVDTYVRVSPLTYIKAIDTPMLLIHGEWDDNEVTTALQSRQLFDALCLVGTPARYVELPCEGHLSGSAECARQTVAEMQAWCERWL
jgi:dipeptidyl aminopeptidase/acylaminoacyl peptidase